MTKQPLLSQRAVPVSAQRHGDWCLEARTDYRFVSRSRSVPLTAGEFSVAAMEYAIVFAAADGTAQPAAVLGLGADENLYLDRRGRWKARYLPAFVRRYPFVFSPTEDEGRWILCIDEAHAGWNREGRGSRLFDASRNPTEYLGRALKFAQEYQRESQRTRAFCARLEELGLIRPMTARLRHASGREVAMTGLLAVDRERLKALPGEALSELAQSGELELIYVHLQSMGNLDRMVARASGSANASQSALGDVGLATEEPLY